MRHREEGWILIGGLLYAKKFRKIIALTIDRSLSLGAKRFGDGRTLIVSLIHTHNRIAMFMDPARWRHRKLPPWRKTQLLATVAGWWGDADADVAWRHKPGRVRCGKTLSWRRPLTLSSSSPSPKLRQCQGERRLQKNYRTETEKI